MAILFHPKGVVISENNMVISPQRDRRFEVNLSSAHLARAVIVDQKRPACNTICAVDSKKPMFNRKVLQADEEEEVKYLFFVLSSLNE